MDAGTHIISIDLGFAGEPTALAVVTPDTRFFYKDARETMPGWENSFAVSHLARFPASDSYMNVAMRTKELISSRSHLPRSVVLINTSSSGAEPLRVFKAQNIHFRAFTVLNGEADGWKGETRGVPKRRLVVAMGLLFQDGRLKVSNALDLGSAFMSELSNFRMRPATSADPIEAMREGKDSDLVFAVGLACWWGDGLQWNDRQLDRMLAVVDGHDEFDSERDLITGY